MIRRESDESDTRSTPHGEQAPASDSPMHRRPAMKRRHSRRKDLIRLQIHPSTLARSPMSPDSEEDILTAAAVSLQPNTSKKRRVQNQRACDRCRLKKSRSLSLGILLPLYAHILIFLASLGRHSPLSVCFLCPLPVGRSPCHSAGDGAPSRTKCSHCLSSTSDCIFTEPTKVRSLPPLSVLLLSTLSIQTRGPPKQYMVQFVFGIHYL